MNMRDRDEPELIHERRLAFSRYLCGKWAFIRASAETEEPVSCMGCIVASQRRR